MYRGDFGSPFPQRSPYGPRSMPFSPGSPRFLQPGHSPPFRQQFVPVHSTPRHRSPSNFSMDSPDFLPLDSSYSSRDQSPEGSNTRSFSDRSLSGRRQGYHRGRGGFNRSFSDSYNSSFSRNSPYSPRNFSHHKQNAVHDINVYITPSILEDPWRHLTKNLGNISCGNSSVDSEISSLVSVDPKNETPGSDSIEILDQTTS